MNALFKKAYKDVTRRKLRALLTIVGIALGVLALTALSTASALVRESFQYTDNTASLPDIQFTTAPTSAQLANTLQQQPNVKVVLAQSNLSTRWTFPNGHFPLSLVGIRHFDVLPFNTFQLLSGRFPQPGKHEVVLESSARAVFAVALGGQISLNVHGTIQQFTVTGFVRTQGLDAATLIGNARAYMDENSLEQFFQLPGVNTFLVRVVSQASEANTGRQLATVLEEQKVVIYHTDVGQATYSNATKTDTLFSIIGIISLVSLVLSVFLLLSTITAVLSEQIPIIGTMKALGAGRRQVFLSYLLSVAFYAVFGTVIGLLAGLVVGYALTVYIGSALGLDFGGLVIEPGLILPGLLIGLGVPLLAAVGPIYTGTRITVRQALSGYGIEARASRLGMLSRFANATLGFLPQQVHFAFRSLFRKRTRLILTMTGLSITGSVFLAVLVGVSSLAASTDALLRTYHVNAEIVISQPLPAQQVEQEIGNLKGVALVEPTVTIPAKIGTYDTQLMGLNPANQFYVKDLQAGRWLTSQDQQSAVINSHMAEKLGLHVGDTVTLHDNLHEVQFQVVGITLDNNGVTPTNVGGVLTTMAQADAFAHLASGASNTFMVHTVSQNPAEIDATAVRIEDKLESLNLLVRVQTAAQLLQTSRGELGAVAGLLAIATAIVALVGAMGLFNSLAMSILERQREVGILRSMGATSRAIVKIFWVEGMTIALLAWIVALCVGIFIAYGFVQALSALLAPLPFTFNPAYLLWMLAFMLGVASLASFGPALGAGKVKIAQTLRYE